jgi:hypothetical protein
MPHQREYYVWTRRVRELLQVIQNFLGSFRFQPLISHVIAITQRWREYLGVEISFDAINRLKPSDEHAKRIHLCLFGRWREITFLAAVKPKFV